MANHTKTLTITDTQQKILSNDLFNDTADNAGIDEWLDGALAGKLILAGKDSRGSGHKN